MAFDDKACPVCHAFVVDHDRGQAKDCRAKLRSVVSALGEQSLPEIYCDWPLCRRRVSRRGEFCARHENPAHL